MTNRIIKSTITVKNIKIGGQNKIALQSMTNTDTNDIVKTLEQINELKNVGCDLVRVAIPSKEYIKSFGIICSKSPLPVIADIHFNYKLAILAVQNGASKIRINPGNISNESDISQICNICNKFNIPIRLGINSGSIEKKFLLKYKNVNNGLLNAMIDSTLYNISLLNKYDFHNICLSIKTSNVKKTILAYQIISEKTNYPLHIGITEAGSHDMGIIKSSIGIGTLLYMGIGDTMRVSLTEDPVNEIFIAKNILQALNIQNFFPEIISCPMCSRCSIDLIKLSNDVKSICNNLNVNIKIAVMGCIVNGIGESKEADIGLTCHNGYGFLFRNGIIIKKIPQDSLLKVLKLEIEKISNEKNII